jgi:Matrixin
LVSSSLCRSQYLGRLIRERTPIPALARISLALVIATCVWFLGVAKASAFCRTTTCKDTDKKKCDRDENDCVTSGTPIFWRSNVVRFKVSDSIQQWVSEAEALAALRKSFGKWNQVECPQGGISSLTVIPEDERPPIRELEYAKDPCLDQNVVFFRTEGWPYRGIDGTLATTTVNFDPETGEIRDADIAINAAFNNLSTVTTGTIGFDLESIVTHEAGHFFGLAHSKEDAIMAATYSKGDINRLLREDDRSGICAAFPPGRQGGPEISADCKDNSGSGCCSAAGPQKPLGPTLPIVGFGALAFVALRLRQGRGRWKRDSGP